MDAEEARRVAARNTWIEAYQRTGSVQTAARRCGVPRSTIYRWIRRYKDGGAANLVGLSRRPKRLAKLRVTAELEEQILEVRRKHRWGPQRIQTYFIRTDGPKLSVPTIWRVLKKHGVKKIKRYRRRKDYQRYSRPVPGDRVQIDVTKIKKGCYQYTAIDDCTRLKVMRLYPTKSAEYSKKFLLEIIDAFGDIGFPIQRVQTDCGPEFYNDAFQIELMEYWIKFRPNPPGKPHLNGKVERGQKTDKEEFYSTLNLRSRTLNLFAELRKWESYYNYERPHSALGGKTPYEQYLELKDAVPTQPEVSLAWFDSNEKIKIRSWERYKEQHPDPTWLSHIS